jgi:FkbM family methyltransferase
MIIQAYKALRSVWNHPLCVKRHADILRRFLKWHIAGRLAPGEIAVEWVNGTRFLARPTYFGFSANVYCGLLEFNDMSFLLHVLRTDDLFVDIGANRGSYTVLAGAAVGARVIAVEPVPETFKNLQANVNLNSMTDRVECLNIGLGDSEGELLFTADASDCVNHVLTKGETAGKTVKVPVRRLDDLVGDRSPFLIKMDVEGYEWFVLKGGARVLADSTLEAIIIEFNNTGLDRYGVGDDQIDQLLRDNGFSPMKYDPFARDLTPVDPLAGNRSGNAIYVGDIAAVAERLKTGGAYNVFGIAV